MVLLVLLLEGVGVGVVEVVEAPPFMLRSVGPVEEDREQSREGEGSRHLCKASKSLQGLVPADKARESLLALSDPVRKGAVTV